MANRLIVSQPFIPDRSPGLALHIISGPKLTDILSRYTGLAGRPPLPPPWAFGPWISADAWRNGGEVRYVVEKSLERGIPASAFVFDSPWEFAYNDFTFNIKDGPNPDDANGVSEPPDHDPTASSVVARVELLGLALARLSERDRQILDWRQDDVTWPEIARRLTVPSAEALRKRHERALARVAREVYPEA